jgi:hypothetical protein
MLTPLCPHVSRMLGEPQSQSGDCLNEKKFAHTRIKMMILQPVAKLHYYYYYCYYY